MSPQQRATRSHDSSYARDVANYCRQRAESAGPPADAEFGSHALWRRIREIGSDLWLDSGDIEENRTAWTDEFSAFTTNNSLLNKEVQKGIYDDLVPDAAEHLRRADGALEGEELVQELAFVVNVVHALTLVRAFDADVCVELHTDATRDVDASYEYGKRVHAVCPERFIVKIAMTPEGLVAARRLEEDGVRVNFTLGFSPRQNYLVARYVRPHFVNVFLGRVNTFFEDSPLSPGAPVGEVATIQSQRMLRKLAADGAIADHTRQIAASMRDSSQVAALAGVDVLTMPVAAATEFAGSDASPPSLEDRTKDDPAAGLEAGPTEAHADVFWTIDDPIVAAAGQLLLRPVDTMTGDRVRAILTDNYLDDLFPELSDDDRARIDADGKVPSWSYWRERVAERTASWDGLLTEAGLQAFAADQAALDERIRGGL